jgi:AcrR family transcriptional regulator
VTATPPRRRGRPRTGAAEGPDARSRILVAARTEFGERGYDKVSVRAIAREAEVDPALVHHYFGSKEQIFAAALETALEPVRNSLESLPSAGAGELGVQVTRFMFSLWENPVTREPMLAIVRSAVNNETAARIFRDTVRRVVLPRLTGAISGPDRELRAELAVAQLVGTVMIRYVIKVEPTASEDAEVLIARLAPTVQHHLTAD